MTRFTTYNTMIRLALVACIVLFACRAAKARTQRPAWLIVPVATQDDETWMLPVVEEVERELRQRGIRVWSQGDAAKRFETRGSRAAMTVTKADIATWTAHSHAALWHLAKGEHAAALEELRQARGLSETATVELNRDKARAQQMLDTCLYMVRAVVETEGRTQAQTEARRCLRLVPHGEPTALMHPPEVTELYRATRSADEAQTGLVAVKSEPSGCPVRLNGLPIGVTPLEQHGIFAGEYGVQVECGGTRGRIHPVQVTSGTTNVFVNLPFDRAVRTEPVLLLWYARRVEDSRRKDDAAAIARMLPADVILLVSAPANRTMELDLVDTTGRHRGFARIRTTARGHTKRTITLAVLSLLDGKCQDFTWGTPVEVDCATRIASLTD